MTLWTCIICGKQFPESKMADDMTCIYCERKIDYQQTRLEDF